MRSIYRFLLQIIICSMLMLPAGSLNIVYADGSTEVGSGDTGSSGTGSTDSGNSGNGSSDTGTSDTGSSESGSTDTGTSGTGSTDDDESDDSEPENSDAAANPDWSYTLSTAEVTITGYNGTATDVVIPDSLEGFPVTSVSDGAFYGKNITSITIPLLLDTIDKNAFRNCKYLTHIYFNSAMCGKIGADAFAGAGKSASSLTVHFGSNVTAVPDGLFDTTGSSGDYPRITSVILPNTVSIVGNKSFKGCAAIKSVDWNRGLTMIGKEAFSGCKRLTSIELPETVEMLGSAAFSDCIKVKKIDYRAKNLTLTGTKAFANVGKSVSSLKVTIAGGVRAVPDQLFCSTKPSSYYAHVTSVKLEEGVREIGDRAFCNCRKLKYVDTPATLRTIGSLAFKNCKNLKAVWVRSKKVNFIYDGKQPFAGSRKAAKFVVYPQREAETFAKNEGFKITYLIPIPKRKSVLKDSSTGFSYVVTKRMETVSLKSIGSSRTTLVIPKTVKIDDITYKVTGIAANALKNRTRLKKVTISANIETIGKNAFRGCRRLKTIVIRSKNLKAKNVGANAFKDTVKKAKVWVPSGKKAAYKKWLLARGLSAKAKVR